MSTSVVTPTPVVESPVEPQQETAEQKYARLYAAKNTPVPEAKEITPPPDPMAPLLTAISELKSEISTVRQSVTPKVESPKPLTPWFEKLREGKWEEAEADLENRIRTKIEAEVRQKATAESTESTRVQIAIDRYLSDLRGQNPDLAPMERYLEAPVARRVEAAQKAGKIASGDDFIREYKSAVDAEFADMRKITTAFRGAGKEDALTRERQVLSATPLEPQKVSIRSDGSASVTPPTETIEDYFTRRKSVEALRKGLSNTI